MASPTPTQLVGSTTTIDSLSDDNLREVMLRVPTPAALVHAAAASRRWRIVVANQRFLGEYRKRHSSSPLLGVYVPAEFGGLPAFQLAGSIRAASGRDLDLVRAGARAFLLGGLESHGDWSVLDCHNGRLLLLLLAGAGGDQSLEVYSPLSCQRVSVPLPPRDCDGHNLSACLLQGRHGDDAASFRVVSVQHRGNRRRNRMVRAVEYDSLRLSWEYQPWKTLENIEGADQGQLMHAGDLIFCKNLDASLLMLDTKSMQFSVLPLPRDNNPKHYAIGEMEDGVCCLASVDYVDTMYNSYLRMWKLDKMEWKLEKEMRLQEVLGKHTSYPYFSVRAVTNGITLLCSNKRSLHFVIDLKTFRVKEQFEFKDLVAYPLQMPWPPTFSVATESDEQSALSAGITHTDMSVGLATDTAVSVDEAQNHTYAAEHPGSGEENDLGSSEGSNISVNSQGTDRLEGSQPFDGAICSGALERDTLDKKIKTIDINPLESKLNTKDSEIPCSDDVKDILDQALLHDSHGNRHELRDEASPQNAMLSSGLEGLGIKKSVANMPAPAQAEYWSDEENYVPNGYDLEASNFYQYLIWNQESDSMHPEAARFHHPETRKSMKRFEHVTQCAFCTIKDPKSQNIHKVESTWGPIQVCRKRQRCPRGCVTDPAASACKQQSKKMPVNEATPERWQKRSRAGDQLSEQDSNTRVRKPNSHFYGPDWETS